MAADREGKGGLVDILELRGDLDHMLVEAHDIRSFGRGVAGGFEMNPIEVSLVGGAA